MKHDYASDPKVKALIGSLDGRVAEVLASMQTIYDECDRAHDFEHVIHMLAMFQVCWPKLAIECGSNLDDIVTIQLAILYHDLDRCPRFPGRDAAAKLTRANFMKTNMGYANIGLGTIERVVEIVVAHKQKDTDTDEISVHVLRDLDKSDFGAIGILRIGAMAAARGYPFARSTDFANIGDLMPADEDLKSAVQDVRFVLEWWQRPEFRFRTETIRNAVAFRFKFMEHSLVQLEAEMRQLGLA